MGSLFSIDDCEIIVADLNTVDGIAVVVSLLEHRFVTLDSDCDFVSMRDGRCTYSLVYPGASYRFIGNIQNGMTYKVCLSIRSLLEFYTIV
jgi:hypothetical protein